MGFFWPAVNWGPALKNHMGKNGSLDRAFLLLRHRAYPCIFCDHRIQIHRWTKTLYTITTGEKMLDKAQKLWCVNYEAQKRPSLSPDNFSEGLIRTTCTFLSKIFGLTFCSPSSLTLFFFFIICLLAVLWRSQAYGVEGSPAILAHPVTFPEGKQVHATGLQVREVLPPLPPGFIPIKSYYGSNINNSINN